MNCHQFLSHKNRYCLNKAKKGQSYCHQHLHRQSQQGGASSDIDPYISPYALIASKLPPNPTQQSWYHYQAPVYQTFGDYVCIKKSFLKNAKNLLNEVLDRPTITLR